MKTSIPAAAFTLVLVLAFLAPALQAGSYDGTIRFSPGDLCFTKSGGYDFVHLKGAEYLTQTGAPSLPALQIHVALPTDATVSRVRILKVNDLVLDGTYDILPNAEPLTLSAVPQADPFIKDPAIYRRDALYPGSIVEIAGAWELVGQDFVTLAIHPVRYNPVEGTLHLATRIDFRVDYREAQSPQRETFNFSEKVKRHFTHYLEAMAHNPEDVARLPNFMPPAASTLEAGNYEYVIITTTAFESAFQPLSDWRTQMGIPARIENLSWIYANYSGTTNQQKIKTFIRDANATWGAVYFLLGGDTGQVPYHKKYINGEYLPNDTYYARLNLEQISWLCNVYVGRACVNSTSEVDNFVGKVLTYEKSPPVGFGNKVFFMGFDLDGSTHGEDLMKKIKDDWVPAFAQYEREYDSESGGHEGDVKSYMSQGQNLVNHTDHCGTSYLGVGSVNHGTGLNNTEAQAFTNGTMYSNFYTLGCWAGNYPSYCWGEALVRDDQGGITFVGNSRYGWYQPGNPYLYSSQYDQFWWKALFSPEFNAYRAGETLAISKGMIFPAPTLYQYIFTELNLFGDPGLHLWTDDPADLTVIHDIAVNPGSQTFSVQVQGSGGALEGALVCLMKDLEVYDFDTTDALGEISFTIDPASPGQMTVTVTGQNYRYYEGTVDVVQMSDPPNVENITPKCGMESGATAVTITGAHFTVGPPISVSIGGAACTQVTVVDDQTITCLTPSGADGREDVTVSNAFGNDVLIEGFRYFPAGQTSPFNGTDVVTDNLDAPAEVTLIASGISSNLFSFFISFGGGPQNTPYGVMGLDLPIYFIFTAVLNGDGYLLFPLTLEPGFGPLDLYIHILGLDGAGDPVWSYGGENPNGSGSIWLHLNN